MKPQDRSNYLIGAGVILCSAILLGALTYALTGASWRTGGRKLAIEFHDATGIKLHSSVRYAGKAAGTVTEIRYLTAEERQKARDPENAVQIIAVLNPDVPPLMEGLTASLAAETLLGEKFIALAPGQPKAPLLAANTVIQGAASASLDTVFGASKEALETVNQLLDHLKSDYPSLVPRLAELLRQGNSILGQGSNLVNNVDATIQNANGAVTQLKTDYSELIPKLNALFVQAQKIATNADQAILKVSSLVDRADNVVARNEGDISKLLEELRVTSQNLKVVTTYAKALTATLAEKPSNLIWGRKKKSLPDEKTILESSKPVSVE